jgi:hypothetical protein
MNLPLMDKLFQYISIMKKMLNMRKSLLEQLREEYPDVIKATYKESLQALRDKIKTFRKKAEDENIKSQERLEKIFQKMNQMKAQELAESKK